MAAIAVEISLDELRKFVPKFQRATTLEIGNELKRQARLLVRSDSGSGLMSVTPPRGDGDGAKNVGENATRRDIERVFLTATLARRIIKDSGARGARSAFKRYTTHGNPDYSMARALDFLNKQTPTSVEVRPYTRKDGRRVRSYTQTRQVPDLGDPRFGKLQFSDEAPSRQLHKSRRNAQGQVKQATWSQLVMSKRAMTSYTEQIVKRVGMLKAGWATAARQAMLGVESPHFVARHAGKAAGKGRFSAANPTNMFVELSNQAPNASSKISQGAVNFVLKLRQKNILSELENRVGKLAKAA
jgi:hypothetical protein